MLEPVYASRMAPILFRSIINGNFDSFIKQNREANEKIIASFYSGVETELVFESSMEPYYYTTTAKNGLKIAILPLMGAITKNGDMCSWGWRDYQNVLARIEKNPAIAAVVLHFNNTPGGSIDGTPEMASLIKNYTKATLGFGDGYVASAHYWAMSQTDHIMASKNNPTEFGSIGALIFWQNIQNQIEKGEYPTMEIIRAPQSTDKALFNPIEPLTDELRAELNSELKDAVKAFITNVKSGRGDKLKGEENVFTGKMYNTDESIKHGLADSKGTLHDAINKAADLGKKKQKEMQDASTNKGTNQNANMKFPKLSALFSGEAWGIALSAFTDDLGPLEAAEQKVATMETDLTKATEEKTAFETRATSAEAKVTELNTQVSTLTSEKAALEGDKTKLTEEKVALQAKLDAKPTGTATTIISDKKEEGQVNDDGSTKEKSFRTKADEDADAYISQISPKSK